MLMYLDKDGKYRDILMFCLLKSYAAKANGNKNTKYGTKVLNFFPTIYANDKRDFGFVSKNLCSIYLRHLNFLSATNRERPFVFRDNNYIIELFVKKVTKTCHYLGDKSIHVAMFLGVDATIIVIGWRILKSHNKIIGGASPNHYLDIGEKSKEEMVEFFKLCVDGKTSFVASEVKVAIVSFQKTPP